MLSGPRDRAHQLPAADSPVRQPALRDHAVAGGNIINAGCGIKDPLLLFRTSHSALHYFLRLPSFTAILVAVILYSTVTLAPFLRSPSTLVLVSRAISNFSLPFFTTILVSVTSCT